jgi:hypothetical protein
LIEINKGKTNISSNFMLNNSVERIGTVGAS